MIYLPFQEQVAMLSLNVISSGTTSLHFVSIHVTIAWQCLIGLDPQQPKCKNTQQLLLLQSRIFKSALNLVTFRQGCGNRDFSRLPMDKLDLIFYLSKVEVHLSKKGVNQCYTHVNCIT